MLHNVLLSLGSNIENRLDHLQIAINSLKKICQICNVSSVYETEPVGKITQSDFYNIAMELKTKLSVLDLFNQCQLIETKLNRVKVERWGPRTIDIDIIAFDDIELNSELLTIPHPEFNKRNFVLIPLNEIKPDFIIKNKTITQHLADCFDKSVVKKLQFDFFLD